MSDVETVRELLPRLREPRLGTHYVYDENGEETGETVDEYKTVEQLHDERMEAADLLDRLTDELARKDAALRDAGVGLVGCLDHELNTCNEGMSTKCFVCDGLTVVGAALSQETTNR